MKAKLFFSLFVFSTGLFAQDFVNGNFENNLAGNADQINLSNADLNAKLPGVTAFGSYGDVDIITSNAYSGSGAQDKSWYIAITGGGTDIVALSLTKPLKEGRKYTITFYDRKASSYEAVPIQVGVSENNTSFGQAVFTASASPSLDVWTKRTFTFTAPANANYVTVQMSGGELQHWAHIDNFTFGEGKCNETLNVTASSYSVYAGETVSITATGSSSYTWTSASLKSSLTGSMITDTPYGNSIYWVMSKQDDCPALTSNVSVSVIQPTVSYVVRDTTPVKPVLNFNKENLNGKKIAVRHTIHRAENELKIIIWDKNYVDGDKVSIYLNGKLLVKNFTLSKIKKEIILQLEPGSNFLMMEAINEGTEPPNTAAIGITNIYNSITVMSDLKTVGAVEIIYTPVAKN
ncbi:MAG: hypothetical protein K0S32_3065 [Bacteroidetes bacterium]|jgi:hypothetical protein|nr:hypothetical protein [Bacteroidota bacterium]